MGMDAERETIVEIRQVVEGAERNKNFVSDPLYIEGQMGRRLEGQSACQKGDHASAVETPGTQMGWTLSGCRSSDFFHHVVGNVEVGMHLLDIVMLIQDF